MKATETNLANNAHSINARNKELSILIDKLPVSDMMYKALLLHDWNAVNALINSNGSKYSKESKYSDIATFMQKYF